MTCEISLCNQGRLKCATICINHSLDCHMVNCKGLFSLLTGDFGGDGASDPPVTGQSALLPELQPSCMLAGCTWCEKWHLPRPSQRPTQACGRFVWISLRRWSLEMQSADANSWPAFSMTQKFPWSPFSCQTHFEATKPLIWWAITCNYMFNLQQDTFLMYLCTSLLWAMYDHDWLATNSKYIWNIKHCMWLNAGIQGTWLLYPRGYEQCIYIDIPLLLEGWKRRSFGNRASCLPGLTVFFFFFTLFCGQRVVDFKVDPHTAAAIKSDAALYHSWRCECIIPQPATPETHRAKRIFSVLFEYISPPWLPLWSRATLPFLWAVSHLIAFDKLKPQRKQLMTCYYCRVERKKKTCLYRGSEHKNSDKHFLQLDSVLLNNLSLQQPHTRKKLCMYEDGVQ